MPDVVAVLAAETSSAQTRVTVLRGCFLTHTTIVAGILGAGLASRDAYAISLIADQIDLFLPEDQSADAPDETCIRLCLLVDPAVAGHSADVKRFLEIETLASARSEHLVWALAIHQHCTFLSIALDLYGMPLAQGNWLIRANNSWSRTEIESNKKFLVLICAFRNLFTCQANFILNLKIISINV